MTEPNRERADDALQTLETLVANARDNEEKGFSFATHISLTCETAERILDLAKLGTKPVDAVRRATIEECGAQLDEVEQHFAETGDPRRARHANADARIVRDLIRQPLNKPAADSQAGLNLDDELNESKFVRAPVEPSEAMIHYLALSISDMMGTDEVTEGDESEARALYAGLIETVQRSAARAGR